jgi:mycofactocin precursor
MTSTVTESVVASTAPATNTETNTETDTAPVDVAADHDDVLAELLIEEISIDGMCGVY